MTEVNKLAIRNILICDDHYFIQLGIEHSLKEILTQKYVIHRANCGLKALEILKNEKIDLAIMDLNLPDISGLEVIKEMNNISPKTKAVVVTSCDQAEVLIEVSKQKVGGIIQKSTSSDHLKACLAQLDLNSSKIYIDPFFAQLIGDHEVVEFTAKENEVLKEIVQGFTNQEIADRLGIALTTVRFHRANILSKSGMRNGSELTAWYLNGKSK